MRPFGGPERKDFGTLAAPRATDRIDRIRRIGNGVSGTQDGLGEAAITLP